MSADRTTLSKFGKGIKEKNQLRLLLVGPGNLKNQ